MLAEKEVRALRVKAHELKAAMDRVESEIDAWRRLPKEYEETALAAIAKTFDNLGDINSFISSSLATSKEVAEKLLLDDVAAHVKDAGFEDSRKNLMATVRLILNQKTIEEEAL